MFKNAQKCLKMLKKFKKMNKIKKCQKKCNCLKMFANVKKQ